MLLSLFPCQVFFLAFYFASKAADGGTRNSWIFESIEDYGWGTRADGL